MFKTQMFVCSMIAAHALAIQVKTISDLVTASDLHTQTSIDTDASTDTYAYTDSDAYTDTDAYIDTDAYTDTDAYIDTEAYIDTDASVGSMGVKTVPNNTAEKRKEVSHKGEARGADLKDFIFDRRNGSEMSMPQEQTGPSCCFFYKKEHFVGEKERICTEGEKASEAKKEDTVQQGFFEEIFTKKVGAFKSFRCGENTWMDMCKLEPGSTPGKCGDKAKNYVSSGGLVDNQQMVRDEPGNVTVGFYDPNHIAVVNLFQNHHCSGGSQRLYGSHTPDERTVEYAMNRVSTTPFLKASGSFGFMSSDTKATYASSFMVPHGYTVSTYAEDNFKDPLRTIKGSFEEDGNGRMVCHNVKQPIKSLRITKNPEGKITSYWKEIMTSSETINYKLTVGTTTTESDTSTSTAVDKLIDAQKTGYSLGGSLKDPTESVSLSMKKTKEESKTHEISNTLQRELSSVSVEAKTSEMSTTCTPEKPGEGVGLWQWVLETEDHTAAAYTAHTVCRHGALAYVQPSCDAMECTSVDCSTCKDDAMTNAMTNAMLKLAK